MCEGWKTFFPTKTVFPKHCKKTPTQTKPVIYKLSFSVVPISALSKPAHSWLCRKSSACLQRTAPQFVCFQYMQSFNRAIFLFHILTHNKQVKSLTSNVSGEVFIIKYVQTHHHMETELFWNTFTHEKLLVTGSYRDLKGN